ncbi:MAG: phosphatidylinositol kinase [marine bacterium B5-7]|nr:MAG: phosphatidylinositol kinase [marine bacterium B5-7]
MTSEPMHVDNAYAWVWLPEKTEPVVAGKISKVDRVYAFAYGKHYRSRSDAIPFSPVELPLAGGEFTPQGMNTLHGALRDAAPDAWGRRLIDISYPTFYAEELDYCLMAGSNRIGALDFQLSADHYEPRSTPSLGVDDIAYFADFAEKPVEISAELAKIIQHGTSVGGARPKCLLDHHGEESIAKFSLSTDQYALIKAEYVAMTLAKKAGLDVAEVDYVSYHDRDIVIVKRFDRIQCAEGTQRRFMLSALSLLQLNEMEARYASYIDLTHIIRAHFVDATTSLHELFKRLVFNVLIGNTDDHARNHAAFWDGNALTLTPAYDLCPQFRHGGEATQAMAIEGAEGNFSTLTNVLSVAHHFKLTESQATEMINQQIAVIEDHWGNTCDAVDLPLVERKRLWGQVICSDFSLRGWSSH